MTSHSHDLQTGDFPAGQNAELPEFNDYTVTGDLPWSDGPPWFSHQSLLPQELYVGQRSHYVLEMPIFKLLNDSRTYLAVGWERSKELDPSKGSPGATRSGLING